MQPAAGPKGGGGGLRVVTRSLSWPLPQAMALYGALDLKGCWIGGGGGSSAQIWNSGPPSRDITVQKMKPADRAVL